MPDATAINERRRLRREALVTLYRMAEAQGFVHPRVDMGALADELAVTEAEMSAIAQHLEANGYLEFVAMGGRGGLVTITQLGILAAEEEVAGPDHGDILEIVSIADARKLEAWTRDARAAVEDESIGGDADFRAQILSLLESINAALKGPRPSRRLLAFMLRNLGAVTLTIGSMSPRLQQLVGSMPGLG